MPHPPKGIDLRAKHHEVEAIVYARFGRLIERNGWDREDVLQDVLLALHVRNHGRSPFDARRSSFGHYVFLVAQSVLRNRYASEHRRLAGEQLGLLVTCDGERVRRDAREYAVGTVTETAISDLVRVLEDQGHERAARIAPLVVVGWTAGEVAAATGLSHCSAARAAARVRKAARALADS